MDNLFTGLISSKTRIKLLIRFFFNPQTQSYLRELAKEFNVLDCCRLPMIEGIII